MEHMSKDIVVVIKSINYSEADKILTVYGRELGKFSLIAKGLRKINSKNRGNMQTLSVSRISFFEGKGLPILTESELDTTIDIENIDMQNVKRVLFLLNKFLQDFDPYPKLFDSLKRVIDNNLDIGSVNKLRMKFLQEMGFLSDITVCKFCGEAGSLEYISEEDFALVCKNCYSKGNCKPLGMNPYSSKVLTEALDRYVRKVVEEI